MKKLFARKRNNVDRNSNKKNKCKNTFGN